MSDHKYKLGWLTSCSPLYVSKLPDWKHHDALLKYLVRDYNVEIHVPVPQAGAPEMMDKVYKGNTTPLYHTLRDLDIQFYPEMKPVWEVASVLDGLVLDGLALFQEIEVLCTGEKISPETQYQYVDLLIENLLSCDKPVILVDNDKVCTRPFNEKEDNVLRKYYLTYKGYDKFYVFSPYDQELDLRRPEFFKHVPFEVDPESLRSITPVEERDHILRYVGNNYYKSETHVPVFDILSKVGEVRVNGKYWTEEDQKNSPNVHYGPAVSLSQDNMMSIYGKSLLGLSGASAMHDESLYHLRWKEMLIAGVYIINEDSTYLQDKLPAQPYNFKTLRDADLHELENFIKVLKEEYEYLVEKQREHAMEFFSVHKWIPLWVEILEI